MSEGRVIDDEDDSEDDGKVGDGDNKITMWLIIGGSALALILIIIIALCICRSRRRKANDIIDKNDDINIGLKDE